MLIIDSVGLINTSITCTHNPYHSYLCEHISGSTKNQPSEKLPQFPLPIFNVFRHLITPYINKIK